MAKEILTFQFGHYSNFIGAHWWNTQEAGFQYSSAGDSPSEINHDVLYREGLTSKGQITFTPRCLLVDLKGSLKTLAQQGDLYDEISEPNVSSVFWAEDAIEVKCDEKPRKNELQQALTSAQPQLNSVISSDLDKSIEVWPDFLYTRFHPRTVNVLNNYHHDSEEYAFDVFNLGKDAWRDEFGEDFSDKIRNYMEECDNLQGFQIVVDAYNGFGGLTSACLEHIKDEYDKKTVLTIPVIPSYHHDYNYIGSEDREKSIKLDGVRTINTLLTLDAMVEESCLTIPLCTGTKGWRQPGPKRTFKNLNYNHESNYHTSAILSSALDTLTMAYRLKSSTYTISDFCSYQNEGGRKISAASLGMPLGIKYREDLIDCLDKFEGPLWQSITPNCKINADKSMHQVSMRGISLQRLKQPVEKALKQRDMPAYRCDSVGDMLEYYLQCTCICSASRVTALNAPMPTKMPFPEIFHENVDARGNIADTARKLNESVESIPLVAGCHTGAFIGDMLDILHRESSRYKISKIHQFKISGLEDDDYKECLNRVLDLRDCYEDSMY